jgi:hypothetical protein
MQNVNAFGDYDEAVEKLQELKGYHPSKRLINALKFAQLDFRHLTFQNNTDLKDDILKALEEKDLISSILKVIRKWNMEHEQGGVDILRTVLRGLEYVGPKITLVPEDPNEDVLGLI